MRNFYVAIASVILCFSLNAQPVIGFQNVTSGFSVPVDIVEEPGSTRLFIVEQTGTIRIWNGSSTLSTPFLNVTSLISYNSGGERGLLSIAFHPQYTTNRYFFIWYTNTSNAVTLARYRRDATNPDIADPTSGVVLLTIPKAFTNHNGAKLNFGPDGYLYIGTGDGGSANDPSNNAQNGTSLLGKLLRIDVNSFATSAPFYNIPSGNPYTSDPAIADEIIALGVRNPWRWSFDKSTGDMWIADVGQNAWEEVHFTSAANRLSPKNYGWSCYEGTHTNTLGTCTGTPANNVFPIFEYPHDNATGGFVVTGGYVYRGTQYPFLQGYYTMVDYATGNGWLIKSNGSGGWTTSMQSGWPTSITTFGETSAGDLYAATTGGTLYRVTATNPLPINLTSFTGRKNGNTHLITWEVQQEKAGEVYIVERSLDHQSSFIEVARITTTSNNAYYKHSTSVMASHQSAYYRLKMVNVDGSIKYSSVIYLQNNSKNGVRILKNGAGITIQSDDDIKQLIITDAAGKLLQQKNIGGAGIISISTNDLPKGVLIIRSFTANGSFTNKVIN